MIDNYITQKEQILLEENVPGVRYDIPIVSTKDNEDFGQEKAIDSFPMLESKDDVFTEIPDFVWGDSSARPFLQQLVSVYEEKKNPLLSYTPIRVEKEDTFFVLDWIFQDKRVSFYFSKDEDNKYSIICYNAKEKTFINSVKVLSKDRYKEIAEEVISYLS